LLDRAADLREYHIGCGVFGRKPDYNPGEDNIVRVEMRLLRKRLDGYFSSEGKHEPHVIVVPKGTYVPVFEPRTVPVADGPTQTEALPSESEFSTMPFWRRLRKWLALSQPVVIFVLAVACIWIWQDRHQIIEEGSAAVPDRGPLWPVLFDNDQQTTVVCADYDLVLSEKLLGHSITLDQYLSRDYLKQVSRDPAHRRSVLADVGSWNLTDLADTELVQRLARLNAKYWNKVSVRSAPNIGLEDFKSGNVILLGSVRSMPWIHLFDSTLRFHIEFDDESHSFSIHNRSPALGEQEYYRWKTSGNSEDAYGVLALVPNLRGTGNVLIIAGNGESREAIGEYLTTAGGGSKLYGGIMQKNHGRIPYFEALLKLRITDGVAGKPVVVASHAFPGYPGSVSGQRLGS